MKHERTMKHTWRTHWPNTDFKQDRGHRNHYSLYCTSWGSECFPRWLFWCWWLMKQTDSTLCTHPVYIQWDYEAAYFRVRGPHCIFLHLIPVGTEIGQPQEVVHKLRPTQNTCKGLQVKTIWWMVIWLPFTGMWASVITLSKSKHQKQCGLGLHSNWCDGKGPWNLFWTWCQYTLQGSFWQCESRSVKDSGTISIHSTVK